MNLDNKFLRIIRKSIINSKIFISRSSSYISIINSGMILFLTLETFSNRGIIEFSNLDKYFFLSLFIGTTLMIVLGYLERKLKGHQEETTVLFSQNPPMKDMKMKIDYIYNKYKEEENE